MGVHSWIVFKVYVLSLMGTLTQKMRFRVFGRAGIRHGLGFRDALLGM